MGQTKKKPRNVLGEASLALVKGDSRRIVVNLALSDVIRYREEARSRGVTLDEYLVSLLNRRTARTQKKPATKRPDKR